VDEKLLLLGLEEAIGVEAERVQSLLRKAFAGCEVRWMCGKRRKREERVHRDASDNTEVLRERGGDRSDLVTAALTATPSSDLNTQVESYRDEQEVLRGSRCLQHSQAARGIGERKLRFTRDSECGIQARNIAYLYPYELG
jgi:hypothetical protein